MTTNQFLLQQALSLLEQGEFTQSLVQLESILKTQPQNSVALKCKVKLGFTSKQFDIAEQGLTSLHKLEPDNYEYISLLVNLFSNKQRWLDVTQLYGAYIKCKPNHAVAQFNYAYYLKLVGEFEQAITHYQCALALNINDPFEVYLNIAAIYNEHLKQDDKAIAMLLDAHKKFPNKDAIVYNLANIYEQNGDKENAFVYFQLAHKINPANIDALSRQADIKRITSKDSPLLAEMASAFKKHNIDNSQQINLAYALGKGFDDCQLYDEAFSYYQQANRLDAANLPLYNEADMEARIDQIIKRFDKSWFNNLSNDLHGVVANNQTSKTPVFICGMFRSGSTLCEQILAAHPEVIAGGEQEYFHRTMQTLLTNYPEGVNELILEHGNTITERYFSEVYAEHDSKFQLTDKRPDNFLYVGLIKSLLPDAKVVWTKRDMLDNCLSVYFLRLGASMNYATDLNNIKHFYLQQERLMRHWCHLFGDDIFEFHYDKLIAEPEQNISSLLTFLELNPHSSCINFHKVKNQVKTASVWQVRQPLYSRSSGRWKNYQKGLKALKIVTE